MRAYKDLKDYEAYLRASGIKDSRMSYLRRLREAYGKPLLKLSAQQINGWIAGLAIAPSTHQLVTTYLKTALKYLNGGDFPPVCKQIARRSGSSAPRVKAPQDLLTDDEVERLINATPRLDLKALVALQRATGARSGEVLRLDWEDVEFAPVNGVSSIRISIRETKTRTPRTVITPSERAIRYLKEWQKSGTGAGPVWTFRSQKTWWTYFKALGKKAGIRKNIYPHLLRHTRGTDLYDAPPNVRDNQMGWKPGSKMYANYTHLRPDQVEDTIIEREGGPPEPEAETAARALVSIQARIAASPDVEKALLEMQELQAQILIRNPEFLKKAEEVQRLVMETDPEIAKMSEWPEGEVDWEAAKSAARRKD